MDEWDAVRNAARGSRLDYEIERTPLDDTGGQAAVFRGRHRATGVAIAMKKLRTATDTDDNVARMRREIDYGTQLEHRNVTSILDHGDEFTWFVMPLAVGSLVDRRQSVATDPDRMLRLVRQVAAGLEAAHERNWVHRDVKPANILRFRNESARGWWVIGDWGLGRGAAGTTSNPGRTMTGFAYGTEGFAAPEMSVDAHGAGATADIYSLGQVIGWLLRGDDPIANVPHLPASGPWLTVVREATRMRPADRPQSMQELLDLVDAELAEPEELLSVRARRQLAQASENGEAAALRQFVSMIENNPTDEELYLDVLPGMTQPQLRTAIELQPTGVANVLRALAGHSDADWHGRSFDKANDIVSFVVRACRAANAADALEVFDAAMDCFCTWDEGWDRWGAQNLMRPFLTGLRGDTARVAAATFRRHPRSAAHFEALQTDSQVDPRIRGALPQV